MTRSIFCLFFFLIGISIVPISADHGAHFNMIPMSFETVNPDLKQISCLAKNIFYEAGSESIIGQAAVARVVLNRINHGFAKTPCDVIYQITGSSNARVCQFSWVCSEIRPIDTEHPMYKQAEKIAMDVLIHDAYSDVIPKSILFFHSILIKPSWSYSQMKVIGNHLFYAKAKVVDNKSQ